MILLGWLGIGAAVFLLDAAVTGRPPLQTLKSVIQTGAIPDKPGKATTAAVVAPQPAGYVAGTTVQGPTTAGAAGANSTAASQSLDTNPWPSAPPAGTYSGNVDGWIAQASTLLEANGYQASQLDPAAIKVIIDNESGGNPYAINTTDSNATAGHPSIGLIQTIRSTFNGNALPGHYDIFNPVDNIVAGVRYAIAKYGSVDNVPGVVAVNNGGKYVGY